MERVAVSLAEAFAGEGHESHLLYFKSRPDEIRPAHPGVKVHQFDITSAMRKSVGGLLTETLARLSNAMVSKTYFLISGRKGGKLFSDKLQELEKQYGRFDRIVFRGIGTFEIVWSFNDQRALHVLENNVSESGGPGWLYTRKIKALLGGKNLVTVSTGVAQKIPLLADQYGFTYKSLRTITNPIPISQIRQKMLEKDERIPDTPFLLNVARLVPQKNHRLLLEAYAKAGTELPLYILGTGRLRDELQQYARDLGIGPNVHFVGQTENPYPWMKAATLFVLSSRVEGLGIVLVEALACGTPVVSVDCPGGVRDIMKGPLEDYLCPMSPEDLANTINATLESSGYDIDERWLAEFEPQCVAQQFLYNSDCDAPRSQGIDQ
ncbi:MAG: glycosyltransferase [Pseudomonadota bacterium]